jgi:hypothetical protein
MAFTAQQIRSRLSPEKAAELAPVVRGAIVALADVVSRVPRRSRTYRRTMPHLRRAAAAMRVRIGDEPTLTEELLRVEEVARGIEALTAALAEATAGAARFAGINEADARALGLAGQGAGVVIADELRTTGNRIQAVIDGTLEGMAATADAMRDTSTQFGGGLGLGIALVGALFLFMKKG